MVSSLVVKHGGSGWDVVGARGIYCGAAFKLGATPKVASIVGA
jgi:hypothetical protein